MAVSIFVRRTTIATVPDIGRRPLRKPGRLTARSRRGPRGVTNADRVRSALLLHLSGSCASMPHSGEGEHGGEDASMELRTATPRKFVQTTLLKHCAQCREAIFLPEWSEYMDRHRVL